MEILFIGVIVVILAFILESNSNSKKAQKKEEKKKNFEEQRTTCTQIGKLDDYYLYHDTSTEDIFIWNLLDDKICCTIKHCKYERIISAYPYFLIFDNENNKLHIINTNESSTKSLNYNDLISIEIIENGEIIFKKSILRTIGGAIAGGVIAGGTGSVIGGLSGDTKMQKEIKSIIVKLLIRDIKSSSIELKLESVFRTENANEIKDCINVIMDKIDKESYKEPSLSITDELFKLNKLKEQNIITEEEFIQQKNKILNL